MDTPPKAELEDIRGLLHQMRDYHGKVRSLLHDLFAVVQIFYQQEAKLRKRLEREFRGISTWDSREWPWDTARLSGSLAEYEPDDVFHGFSVRGPNGSLFDLGRDALYYNLDEKPHGFNEPVPIVPWTPRRLAARCAEIMTATTIDIVLDGTATAIPMGCPCGAVVPNVQIPGPTPRLDHYEDDRLVCCPKCNSVRVIFVEGLRHAH